MTTVANTAAYDDSGLGRPAISAGPQDYVSLLKPRVMSLVVFTALVGMVLAPGGIHPVIGLVALIAIAVGAGASGALNMWYDADIDRVMGRTANRPVPSGRVSADGALQFGSVLAVMSVMVLGVVVNWASAAFLAFTIFFYVAIYTMWLKRWTPQNIVIGGAAGAFPPMIGWTAVTGVPSLESAALFLIIFLWTPPHFWALAILKRDDYARAGVPMLPVVAGEAATRRQIFAYTLLLVASSFLPVVMGFGGWLYGVVAAVLAAGFIRAAWRLVRIEEGPAARGAAVKVFLFSITYLFALFGALLAERILGLLMGAGS